MVTDHPAPRAKLRWQLFSFRGRRLVETCLMAIFMFFFFTAALRLNSKPSKLSLKIGCEISFHLSSQADRDPWSAMASISAAPSYLPLVGSLRDSLQNGKTYSKGAFVLGIRHLKFFRVVTQVLGFLVWHSKAKGRVFEF